MKTFAKTGMRRFVGRYFLVLPLLFGGLVVAAPAEAGPGPCVGTPTTASSTAGIKSITATGCDSGVPSGDANVCDNGGSILLARWPSTAARLADGVGGCIFMCASGDCRVGNDGLPVELLGFGIE